MQILAKCPRCSHKRYDRVAMSCERRQCGYAPSMIKLPASDYRVEHG